jgi:hypothetical protein
MNLLIILLLLRRRFAMASSILKRLNWKILALHDRCRCVSYHRKATFFASDQQSKYFLSAKTLGNGNEKLKEIKFHQCDPTRIKLLELLRSGLDHNPGIVIIDDRKISQDDYTIAIESQQCGAEDFSSIAEEEGLLVKVNGPDTLLIQLNDSMKEEDVHNIVRILYKVTSRIGERF